VRLLTAAFALAFAFTYSAAARGEETQSPDGLQERGDESGSQAFDGCHLLPDNQGALPRNRLAFEGEIILNAAGDLSETAGTAGGIRPGDHFGELQVGCSSSGELYIGVYDPQAQRVALYIPIRNFMAYSGDLSDIPDLDPSLSCPTQDTPGCLTALISRLVLNGGLEMKFLGRVADDTYFGTPTFFWVVMKDVQGSIHHQNFYYILLSDRATGRVVGTLGGTDFADADGPLRGSAPSGK